MTTITVPGTSVELDFDQGRMASVLVYAGLVATGVSVGVIFAAVRTMQAAPSPPPAWTAGLSAEWNQMVLGASGFMAVCLVAGLWLQLTVQRE